MPSYDFKSPRLYVGEDLAAGRAFEANPVQTNHLLNVLRRNEDDHVLLFNGRDGEWLASLKKPSKKKLTFVPIEEVRAQTPASDLIYCFAPLKVGRLDYMVQKAVEMGAGVLQPVLTDFTQSHRIRIDKIEANAVEAAEQCGILTLPQCREPLKFEEFIAGWNTDIPLVMCDERMDAESPIDALASLSRGPKGVLIGPEGGFSPAERKRLGEHSFVRSISLGPRILRADTAAVAALALLQAVCGDWQPVA
ncbi:16S rRNA (uracil(1498)-N(3))-methyltransferase [Fulvimarina endophytica]|uniref:Ribosomal RNA small subunit methyltransferase E n=1 Tax=Fulvimarina endophytica TaxID=2293836 RepID=A0A371X836_9HYPH|nr:16S rRNA (uracil(1498)-N(3))-methyltransferase [Fulvimarina endophytica]RFC65387.1 16S rRNA (uracil(1498)-N(3))-methyltransferase [Fulvimarina endophytica]